MDAEFSEIRRDVGEIKTGLGKMEASFSGAKELTETLMQAIVNDHRDYRVQQKELMDKLEASIIATNSAHAGRLTSLESSRDRLWGYFIGAAGTGGSLGAFLSRFIG